jgi:hypothetical protein
MNPAAFLAKKISLRSGRRWNFVASSDSDRFGKQSACPTTRLLDNGNPTTRRKIGGNHGWVAQLAEQWTENPRVAGSIPAPATF